MEIAMIAKTDSNIEYILSLWANICEIVAPIRNEKHYDKVIALMDNLADLGINDNPERESLFLTLSAFVEVYEKNKYSEPKRDPIGNLKFLMEQHQLKQDDMTELGKQGSVSDILRGRRNLTVPQITALSKRFSISPNVFISGSE